MGCFVVLIVLAITISELIKNKWHWPIERSRKLVHVMVGIMVSVSPLLFQSNQPPAVVALLFIGVNIIALRSNRFQAMHATQRKTFGTVFFPIAYLILVLFWWERPVSLITGTLLMTFADTTASIVGHSIANPRLYRLWTDRKSLEGSIGMFTMSFFIVLLTTLWARQYIPVFLYPMQIISLSGIIALLATAAESVSKYGSDNFSVPVITALCYDLYLASIFNNTEFALLLWIFLSLATFILAVKLKALTPSGGIGAFIMGTVIFSTGGLKWLLPLAAFFVLSSLLSKLGQEKHSQASENNWNNHQKSSRRDILQVLANGIIATIIAIIAFYSGDNWLYLAFLGAIAAATADTWATEIGYFSKRLPRDIISFKQVEKGTSGGVSILGTLGTLLGGLLIGLTGMFFGITIGQLLIVVMSGLVGSMIDSIIGGTFQSRYQCSVCHKSTEKHTHCGEPTNHIQGIRLIDNDMVNLVCTFTGALVVFLHLF